MSKQRKILIITIEPPPTSSGLGTLWAKLAKHANSSELRIDFFGPNPHKCSPYGVSDISHNSQLYSPKSLPFLRLLSVKRNSTKGLGKIFWTYLYGPFYLKELIAKRVFKKGTSSYISWFISAITSELPQILSKGKYDAVGVHVSPAEIADSVCAISEDLKIPFLFVVGDPLGYRNDKGEFFPNSYDSQQKLIDQCSSLIITKETYSRYYSKAFRVDPSKVMHFCDCFMQSSTQLQQESETEVVGQNYILHWGNVSPWRPIDKFIEALASVNTERRKSDRMNLAVMGKVNNEESRHALKRAGPELSVEMIDFMPYREARKTAEKFDYFIVAVSSRHMDNIPSKLIDLLSFKRPILLLGHPDSEAAKAIRRLEIGTTASPENKSEIVSAIKELESRKHYFSNSYRKQAIRNSYGCSEVASRFRNDLFEILKW